MSEAEARAVRKFQDWLQQALPGQVERLILFGSKARGDAHAESDIDVLVELREATPNSATGCATSQWICTLKTRWT
jgi:predicted nucleotidyltransferase